MAFRGDGRGSLRRSLRALAAALPALLPLCNSPAAARAPGDAAAAHREAWTRMGPLVEALARSAGTDGGRKAADAAASLVDLHAAYAAEVLGAPVAKERCAAVAAGCARAAASLGEPAPVASFRAALRNRALFLELLGGGGRDPESAALLIRNWVLRDAVRGPVGPSEAGTDIAVAPHEGEVLMEAANVRILSDVGLEGNRNGGVDAGETVTILLPLVVSPRGPVSVSRGLLRSPDPLVRLEDPEVAYVIRDMTGKAPPGSPPGTVLRPRTGYTFTVLPGCPDGREVPFELEFIVDGGGRTIVPFTLRVRSVGPLEREKGVLKDAGVEGARGNGNGILEPGESGMLVTSFRLRGASPLESVVASMESLDPRLVPGKPVPAGERDFSAVLPGGAVVHRVLVSAPPSGEEGPCFLPVEWSVSAVADGRSYAWWFPGSVHLGIDDAAWEETLRRARADAEDGYSLAVADRLSDPAIAYRMGGAAAGEARRLLDEALAELGPGYDREGDRAVGGGAGGVFGARQGKERAILREGGEGTEAAVEAGLRWLAAHQSGDGHWGARSFPEACGDRPCGGPGNSHYDTGVTGLAILAFLASGETHRTPRYGGVVRRGLDFLVASQGKDGCIGPPGNERYVYGHAVATWALCEAYGMTGSRLFRGPAERGVAYILAARNPGAAWRYGVRPGDNDTSVTVWMVGALAAAEWAGLAVDAGARKDAIRWIESVTDRKYGRVGYTEAGIGPARMPDRTDAFPAERSESTPAMGTFMRILGGEGNHDLRVQQGADLCLKVLPTWNEKDGSIDFIYWHFGSLTMFQVGGPHWKLWNAAVKKALVSNQVLDERDHRYGSWESLDPWGPEGGRVYSTALNVLTLQTYHRYPRLQ